MLNTRVWSSRWLVIGVPVMAAVLLLVIAGGYFLQKERFRQQERRLFVHEETAGHAHSLERLIEQAVAAPGLLATVIHTTKELDHFDAIAERVLHFHNTISLLQIAPGGMVWRTFTNQHQAIPSHSPAWPDNLVRAPAAQLAPFGSPAITGDVNGMVVSQPVHAYSGDGESRFWGYALAVAKPGELAAAAHLDELRREGFDFQLAYRTRGSAEATVIGRHGDVTHDEPIVTAVSLPNGDTLELSVLPRGGWGTDPFFYGELALVLTASLLLGVFLHVLLRQPEQMRRAVEQRTHGLQETVASLERSKAMLDSVFENLPLMLVLKQADDLKVVRVNSFAEDFLGRERSALTGRTSESLLPADQARRLDDADIRAIFERRPIDLSDQRIRAADAERIVSLRVIPLFGTDGHCEYVLEIAEDITDRHLLAKSMESQLHFLEQLIDSIPAPVFFKDTQGCYINVNRAFEHLYGRARDEVVGSRVESVAPGIAMVDAESDRELLRDGGHHVFETTVQGADGESCDVVAHKAVFRDEAGDPAGIVGIQIDISERKAAERRIAQLNRTFAVLTGINETIVRVRERAPLLEQACEILVERGQFPLVWAYLRNDGSGNPPTVLSEKGTPSGLAGPLTRRLHDHVESGSRPAADDRPRFYFASPDGDDATIFAESAAHGLRALAILPLGRDGHCIGGLGIFSAAADAFSPDEQKVLADLADDLAHALDSIEQEARRRSAESDLKLAAQVFENSSEGIMITDAANLILMVNKAFSEVTGYQPGEVIGRNPRLLSSGKQGPGFYREMWNMLDKRGEWHGEVQNRRKNGEFYSEWLTISAVKNSAQQLTNYVAVFSDITSTKQIEERLNFLANYDSLTALPNRILFSDRLEQAITQARNDNKHVALIFLDLDRFNLINETFGHSAGDLLLQEIASRLKANVRRGDSVARMGGDEFSVILPDLDSPDEAGVIAGKIMQALGVPLKFEDRELFTSASIGISVFPEDGDSVEALTRNADSAMYRAMEEGRNTFCFYHQQMNARSAERMSLESQLRHALERGELAMHYQPFIDARSGRIVGAEALLRWHRPGLGYVTPTAFIPLLEETGLIVPVGEWVLKSACEDNQAWRDHGHTDLFVAVNFSALQLADVALTRKVADILAQIGFDPRRLEIELTESMVMRDAERGIRTLHALKEIGAMLSVDDFGTGYSSLSYLKRLPIDTLKVDRSFVTDTPGEKEANAIVQAIIAMGHSLDLHIIAEGVQEAAQVNFLRQARCDLLQGFYFSTAVKQAEFLELLRSPPAIWQAIDWSQDLNRKLRSIPR